MNNHDNDYLNMAQAVSDCLTDNNDTIKNIAPVVAAQTTLDNQIEEINISAITISTGTTGVAEDKSAARLTIEDDIDVLVGYICGYALSVNNNTLHKEFYKTHSDLLHLPGNDLNAFSLAVIAEAGGTNKANYITAGMEAADLTNASKAQQAYNDLITAPRDNITTREADNASLHTQVDALRPTLTLLDNLIRPFRVKNNKFYNAYQASRKIVNSATHSTALLVLVTDQSNNPIVDATVAITDTDNEYSDITGNDGTILFKPITYGQYNITVSATGYTSTTVKNIVCKMGQKTNVTVVLKGN